MFSILGQVDTSIISLIGAMGASGAAVFVTWFLTTSYLQRQTEQQSSYLQRQKEQEGCMVECQAQLLSLAKDKGDVIRQNAVAMDRLSSLIGQMVVILEKIEHDVPPGELVAANTKAIDRLEHATENLVSGLRFAAEHLPPSTVAVPTSVALARPESKS
jgi:hypothetical protein